MIKFPDFWLTEDEYIDLVQRIDKLNLLYKGHKIRERTEQSIIEPKEVTNGK